MSERVDGQWKTAKLTFLIYGALGALAGVSYRFNAWMRSGRIHPLSEWFLGPLIGICGALLVVLTAALILKIITKRTIREIVTKSPTLVLVAYAGGGLTDAVITGLLERWHWL